MLRDAQIPCYPVVMSRKNRGILPYSHPSIQKLNTLIVGIADTDSTFVFLDGSVTDGYLNTLPPVLMANRARLIDETGKGKWVDLSTLGKNQIRASVKAQIHPDGMQPTYADVTMPPKTARNLSTSWKRKKISKSKSSRPER